LARFVVLRAGDDFIVDARNNLFDGLAAIRISRFGTAGFAGFSDFASAAAIPGFSRVGPAAGFG